MKTYIFVVLILLQLTVVSKTFSQSVSINTTGNAADTSAMLDISSASKGILIPRMTQAQKLAIFTPSDGLLVYQSDGAKGFYFYNIATPAWVLLAQGSGGITSLNGLTGASQTFATPGTNGTAPAWTSSGSVHTLNIPLASATGVTAGMISNADYLSFSNQLSNISANAPLTYSNGNIGITQSSTTEDGYLSTSDYNIFNSKVSSIALNGGALYTTTSFGIVGGAATGTLVLNSQVKNRIFAGPISGANAQPTFRSLIGADLPIATTNTTTGLGAVIVGSGLSVNAAGILSVTNPSGGGTVTSVSGSNGVTVATGTTTPVIGLGAITPASVAATGTLAGSNFSGSHTGTSSGTNTGDETTATIKTKLGVTTLSGSNTGDQTITLTGDVTGSGTGSFPATIAPNAVTYDKMQAVSATNKLLGSSSATTAVQELTIGSGLNLSGTTLSAAGSGGTVTSVSVAPANGVSATVATATTTPAITLILGAITPSSVAATGTVAGSNLSGTNTGDETQATIKTKLGPATTSADGYLTLADWNTFNNKASTTNVISSLNGLTATTQTFATPGTAGTAPAWVSAGSAHTLNIPLASAAGVTAGLLSNADWNTFNNKASAANVISSLNGLTATTQTFATGTTGSDFNIISGSSTHTFNIPDASATARGVVTTGTQTIAGSKTFAAAPIFSSLTAGSVPFIGSGGLLSENNTKLFWDATNSRLGIGTVLPTQKLDVNGSINASTSVISQGSIFVDNANTNTGAKSPGILFGPSNSGEAIASKRTGGNSGGLDFYTSSINRLAITQGGNVGIGVVLPANKLQVSATADPLSLLGVQTGAATDSVLTIINGVVRKVLPSALTTSSGNVWTTTGNSGTTAANNFIGTTDARGFRVKVNTAGIQGLLVDSLGNVAVGNAPVFTAGNAREKFLVDAGSNSANPTPTGAYNVISGKGYLDSYLQLNIQNNSPGIAASSDIVASSDAATETTNFIDMGINSSGNTTAGPLGGANTGYLYSTGNDFAIGNGTSTKSLNFFTTDAGGSAERMRILGDGKVGIGTTAPATALHVSAAINPLTLSGVATGTNTSADSLLTITNGLVRKLSLSTFASPTNSWSTTGNAGTTPSTNFLGTTDNNALKFGTNNVQAMLIDATGNIGIGSAPVFSAAKEKLLVDAGTATSTNVISGKGSIDSYLQLNIQNKSATAAASSDVVATADNGDETTNFVDLGINSSANTANYFGNSNDAYLYTAGQNLMVGTATADKDVVFLTGGGTQGSGITTNNERMRIDGTTGYVGIGTNTPQTLSHTLLSTASAATPTDVATIETINTTTTATALPPQFNLVRQYPAALYTNTTTAIGPVINFAFKSAGFTGARGDLAQVVTSTYTGNSRIGFSTRTGMTNGNPSTGTLAEAMSLVGTNLGIGAFVNPAVPVSTLEVNGSVGHAITTSAVSITLNATHYTVILTGSATGVAVTLPAASASTRRIYVIVNQNSAARTITSYTDFLGAANATALPANSSITVQSNGTNWYRIQ